jgi:hypothetical protein
MLPIQCMHISISAKNLLAQIFAELKGDERGPQYTLPSEVRNGQISKPLHVLPSNGTQELVHCPRGAGITWHSR